jgi:NAD(P)-dependent dehydrogenase (short-subunit alcohol dehydrogenase family)
MGYQVFATARKIEDVEKLSKRGLQAYQLDLADSESIKSAVAQVLDQTGGQLYALFNNGAYGQPGAVEDLSREVLREQFETNLFGTHELTQLIMPVMRKQGEGRIIQNSSVLGFVALKFRGAYNASKFALEGLSDTMRLELQGSNIHVVLIEPGPVTSLFRKNAALKFMQHIDRENSHFSTEYQAMVDRLQKEGPAVPFTLPPDAVMKKVALALEKKIPNPRYYVTFPTYLFGYLKRILSSHGLDKILNRV